MPRPRKSPAQAEPAPTSSATTDNTAVEHAYLAAYSGAVPDAVHRLARRLTGVTTGDPLRDAPTLRATFQRIGQEARRRQLTEEAA